MIGHCFAYLDGWLAVVLAEHARLFIWAVGSGTFSMLLYRLCSRQEQIRALEAESVGIRQALAEHEGEFAEALPLLKANFVTALKRLRLAAAPSLLAGLPIILCLVGLEATFASFEFIPWGPDWLSWWGTGFLIVSSFAALGVKLALRIK